MAAQPRQDAKNTSDPRGKFGAFLAHWLDRQRKTTHELAATLNVSERTIRKWREGAHGPAFEELDRVAVALGYTDWSRCYAAALRFCDERGIR